MFVVIKCALLIRTRIYTASKLFRIEEDLRKQRVSQNYIIVGLLENNHHFILLELAFSRNSNGDRRLEIPSQGAGPFV